MKFAELLIEIVLMPLVAFVVVYFAVFGAGERVDVLPGGLTRVALREGSLIVNSSRFVLCTMA